MELAHITYVEEDTSEEVVAKHVKSYIEGLGHLASLDTVYRDEYYSWGEYPVVEFSSEPGLRLVGEQEIQESVENGTLAAYLESKPTE